MLDPTRAAVIGARYVGSQDVSLSALAVTTAQDGSSVTVEVIDHLELGVIGVFVDQEMPLEIRVEATAVPVAVP